MAKSCPNCHFAGNPDSEPKCLNCGKPFPAKQVPVPSPAPPNQPATQPPPVPSPQYQLEGKITWLETTSEQADFDWYRFSSQFILFLIFLPLFAAIFILSFTLYIAFAILGFRTISHGLSPFNLINTVTSMGTLVAIVFPRVPRCDQVPVIRFTVQNTNGETAALIKGQLVAVTLRNGDDIQLRGNWRHGELVVENGFNRTINTGIVLRRNYWQIVFWIIMSVLAVALIIAFRSH